MTQHSLGRTLGLMTLTAPGDGDHARWGLHGRSTGVPCHCHEPLERTGVAGWNVGAARRWNSFVTALRRQYPGLEYLRAAEPQKRGAIHLHVITSTWGAMDPAVVQAIALRTGFGCVIDLQTIDLAVDDSAARGTSHYVSKYVTKAADARSEVLWEVPDPRTGEMVPSSEPTYRTWSSSRGWGVQMRTVMRAIRASSRAAAARMAADPPSDLLPGRDQTSLVFTTGRAPPG